MLHSRVEIFEKFHGFKSWSQLEDESKGGYLIGKISVPPKVHKIELALFTKGGSPHPNLLFVTPHFKKPLEKAKPMKAEDYKVTLRLLENGEIETDPLNYWPGKTCGELMKDAWNPETRTLTLGKSL